MNRTMQHIPDSGGWRAPPRLQPHAQRLPFGANNAAHGLPFRSATTVSDNSDSATEVEMLVGSHPVRRATATGGGGWGIPRGPPGKPPRRKDPNIQSGTAHID